MPPQDVKRPAIKKQMHCVNFFGTNDFAWIKEFSIKGYEQFKDTFIKSKQTKQMSQAIEEIEVYLKTRYIFNLQLFVVLQFLANLIYPADMSC